MNRIALLALTLAGSTAAAQESVKPRPLGAVQATSKELIGLPTLARPLPNGSVIVNDAQRRRLLLLDPSLENYTVIADSTSGSTNGYGQRPGSLIPYLADSTLFLDATAGSFLVIDPAGKVARVMSPPRPSDNNAIANAGNGIPGFDASGRMVYRTAYRNQMQQTRDGSIQMSPPVDTAPLLRVDLDTRRADTIAHLRLPRMTSSSITLPNGGTSSIMMQVPLAAIDDWAVLSDGSIAVIRGRDYKIDFVNADGTRRTSDKIAFDWRRLSDDDKLAIADSIGKARATGSAMGGGQQTVMFGGGDGMRVMVGGGGGGGAQVMTREVMTAAVTGAAAAPPHSVQPAPGGTSGSSAQGSTATSGTGGTPAAANAASGAPAGGPAPTPTTPTMPAPSVADLPDYMPAFTQTSARPDADANLWIRTTTPGAQPGNLVYDVINNQGILVHRVDVPKGMQIVGFARGGVVYLSQREGYGYRIVKALAR